MKGDRRITVRGVAPKAYASIKRLAANSRRSINAEILVAIENHAKKGSHQ